MDRIPVRKMKESFLQEHFSIRRMDAEVADGDLVHRLHRHDFYFILFIRSGRGEHEIDFVRYEVGDFSVFFIRPGQVHQLLLKQGATGYLLQFTPEFYTPSEMPAILTLRKASSKSHCRVSAGRFQKIDGLLQSIYEEAAQKQNRYKAVIKALFDILFIELVRQSPDPDNISGQAGGYSQERLEEFQDLLEKNISTKKQVSEYADMLHLTTYQLNAITKETVGKSCSQLITEQVLLEAKRHLLATGNQVNQIAFDLGYQDTSYFIRFFKKHTGYSPELFRQHFK